MRKRVLLLAGFSIAFVSAVFIILFKRFFVGADEIMVAGQKYRIAGQLGVSE